MINELGGGAGDRPAGTTVRVEAAVAQAVRDLSVEPWPGTPPLLTQIAVRMYAIFTGGGVLADDTDLDHDNAALNAIGTTASRYGALGVRELGAILDAGGPFREDVTVRLPASHRKAVEESMSRPPTRPDFWPGPVGYAVALHEAVRAAESEQDGSDARTFYLMGLRVAAGLYGLPDGSSSTARREAMRPLDLMPVFVIKGKDWLAPDAVDAYRRLCLDSGLPEQAVQVALAGEEIRGWQRRHPDRVRVPSHEHVPVGGEPR